MSFWAFLLYSRLMRLNSLLCLCLLTSTALAHPLAGEARAIEEQALVLRQKMGPDNPSLSWGQKMAVDDMSRLATAASAVRQATESEEVDWENSRAAFMELEVASNRVRMSLPVSTLDAEAQKSASKWWLRWRKSIRPLAANAIRTSHARWPPHGPASDLVWDLDRTGAAPGTVDMAATASVTRCFWGDTAVASAVSGDTAAKISQALGRGLGGTPWGGAPQAASTPANC
jgi:hypothetical protein